jgi:hypothetical protein
LRYLYADALGALLQEVLSAVAPARAAELEAKQRQLEAEREARRQALVRPRNDQLTSSTLGGGRRLGDGRDDHDYMPLAGGGGGGGGVRFSDRRKAKGG